MVGQQHRLTGGAGHGPVKDLTVISNSLEILRLAGEKEGGHVISTGGKLRWDVMALSVS